jgi:glycosyltransferase involved in cell wall biosynthesis
VVGEYGGFLSGKPTMTEPIIMKQAPPGADGGTGRAADARRLSGRTIIVSEEALQSEVGHFFEYNKAVVYLCQGLGATCNVAVHANANDRVRNSLPAKPVFARTSWGSINTEPDPVRRYMAAAAHNLMVFRTMSRLVDELGPVDVVFAPTVTIYDIVGWRMFAARYLGSKVGRLVLLIRNAAARYEEGSSVPIFKASQKPLAAALRSFKHFERDGRYTFATDSERLADEYEALSGCRPVVFPSPRIAPASSEGSLQQGKCDDRVVFASLGPARLEKGIDIFQAAIAKVLKSGLSRDARFVVQWNMPILGPSGQTIDPDAELVRSDRVRILTEDLSSEGYNAELLGADCIVLPYRRDAYFARISGIAVEAATAGIPMIYTCGTWCEDLVTSSGAGIGVPDGDADALANAMIEMAANIVSYRHQAAAAAERARAAHSAEAFIELLWGLESHSAKRAGTGPC